MALLSEGNKPVVKLERVDVKKELSLGRSSKRRESLSSNASEIEYEAALVLCKHKAKKRATGSHVNVSR